MTLTLRIISGQQAEMGSDACKVFQEQSGSIGRLASNDWVLPDDKRYLSGRHCAIQFRNEAYYLQDTSTNGVYVNAAAAPLGKGQKLLLHSGDRLSLGEYEIAVEIARAAQFPAAAPFYADPFSTSPVADANLDSIYFHAHRDLNFQNREGQPVTDPLELLGKGSSTSAPACWDLISDAKINGAQITDDKIDWNSLSASRADNLPLVAHFFQPPAAINGIPEDWDLIAETHPASQLPIEALSSALFSNPAPPAASEPQPPVIPMELLGHQEDSVDVEVTSKVASLQNILSTAVSLANGDVMGNQEPLAAFFEGAKIFNLKFLPEQNVAMMRTLGQMTREMVQGMIEMLMARASLKSEFRLAMTVIRPVENNPLKFCLSADDALRTMLTTQGHGYLPPLDAVQEGLEDIKGHQMALMAGMQSAIVALLKRFDPKSLIDQAEKNSKFMGFISSRKKEQAWDLYVEQYKTLAQDAEDNLQVLLGAEFRRAYEEQIEKIEKLRQF